MHSHTLCNNIKKSVEVMVSFIVEKYHFFVVENLLINCLTCKYLKYLHIMHKNTIFRSFVDERFNVYKSTQERLTIFIAKTTVEFNF